MSAEPLDEAVALRAAEWFFLLHVPGLWRALFPTNPEMSEEEIMSPEFATARCTVATSEALPAGSASIRRMSCALFRSMAGANLPSRLNHEPKSVRRTQPSRRPFAARPLPNCPRIR